MNLPSGQKIGAVPPWRERLRFLLDGIEVRGAAPVRTVPLLLCEISFGGQLVQGALDCGAGELQVGGDGAYPRPAFALGVGAVLEVHINGHGPVGNVRIGVDSSEVAHSAPHDFTWDSGSGFPVC